MLAYHVIRIQAMIQRGIAPNKLYALLTVASTLATAFMLAAAFI